MLSSSEVPVVGRWTLRLPEADFRTPGGVRVEGNGVEPDIVVQREPGISEAAKVLGRKRGMGWLIN